jgi:transcriptional regulator with XRE-family HTH domain
LATSNRQREIKKEAAYYFRTLIARKGIPRNQIASLSGLSNAYICHLENGQIANASRDKLIAFGVALSLDLSEIDQLLTVFDRSRLTKDDIPLFIETGGHRKISKAMLPLHDWYAYELHIMIVERVPGTLIIVNDRPTAAITPEGFRTYRDQRLIDSHPIYKTLIEEVGKERKNNLTSNLSQHSLEHYICRRCLEGYLENCQDPVEKEWRRKHVEQLFWYVSNFKNFKLFICEACSRFTFTLKIPEQDSAQTEKLLFMGRAPHGSDWEGLDHLSGFATENQLVIANFKEGLDAMRRRAISKLKDRKKLQQYLQDLVE